MYLIINNVLTLPQNLFETQQLPCTGDIPFEWFVHDKLAFQPIQTLGKASACCYATQIWRMVKTNWGVQRGTAVLLP